MRGLLVNGGYLLVYTGESAYDKSHCLYRKSAMSLDEVATNTAWRQVLCDGIEDLHQRG